MITDADIKKLKEVFATKDDLKGFATKEDLKRTTDAILQYVDTRFESIDHQLKILAKVERIVDEVENKIVEFKDEILQEIVAMRQELSVTLGHRDILENHEVRITKLEKKSSSKSN